MKNKLKIVLSLLLCIALFVLIITGCTTKYNLSIDKEEMSLSDIAEKALPSCVLVEVTILARKYQCVGLAINENDILIARQAIPKDFFGINGQTKYKIAAKNSNKTYDAKLENLQGFEEKGQDFGIAVLRLVNADIKLVPVEFSNSDLLKTGDILMGIDLLPFEMQENEENPYRVFETMTSALSMCAETISVPTNFREEIKQNAFTIDGNLSKSRPSYEHKLLEMCGVNFELCSAFLFDCKGNFVGLNCAKIVGPNSDNSNVVYGVGYATRANVIKKQLEDKKYI